MCCKEVSVSGALVSPSTSSCISINSKISISHSSQAVIFPYDGVVQDSVPLLSSNSSLCSIKPDDLVENDPVVSCKLNAT